MKLHGGVDILISNAAVNPFFGNLMDVTEEVWDKVRKDESSRGWASEDGTHQSAFRMHLSSAV